MKLKGFFAGAAGCAMIAGAVFGVAGPAAADPNPVSPTTPIEVDGGGSDTTQDVLNAIANDTGFSSWNALPPHSSISTKATLACTDITRPNGSGEGVTALRRSLSNTPIPGSSPAANYPNTTASYSAGTGNAPPGLGSLCLDFARSSSGPGSNASSSGLLQYVPFALDGVTVAVGPASGADATNIRGTFDLAELQSMYSTGNPAVGSDGVTYDPNPDPVTGGGLTGTPIHLLVPQSGSGTRSFFAGAMGFSATALPTYVTDTFTPSAGGAAQSVQEHDGSAVQLDHNALMPYSTAQWLAQQSHPALDRRHGAVLQNIGTLSPVDATGLRLNKAFHPSLVREVFNVIPFAAVSDTNSNLYKIFVSTNNPVLSLCGSNRITEFGFGRLDSTTPHTCGQIDPALQAYSTTQW